MILVDCSVLYPNRSFILIIAGRYLLIILLVLQMIFKIIYLKLI